MAVRRTLQAGLMGENSGEGSTARGVRAGGGRKGEPPEPALGAPEGLSVGLSRCAAACRRPGEGTRRTLRLALSGENCGPGLMGRESVSAVAVPASPALRRSRLGVEAVAVRWPGAAEPARCAAAPPRGPCSVRFRQASKQSVCPWVRLVASAPRTGAARSER